MNKDKKGRIFLICLAAVFGVLFLIKELDSIQFRLVYEEVFGVSPFWEIKTEGLRTGKPQLYGAEGSDTTLLVIQKGNRFGYGDTWGNTVIAPQFEEARPFFEGLAAVRKGGKYGYIDKTGKTAIPFQFNDALDFRDGGAYAGGRYVISYDVRRPVCLFINRSGQVLKQLDYYRLRDCAGGLVFAKSTNNKDFSFLNSAGNVEMTIVQSALHPLESCSGFQEGLCAVNVQEGAFYLGKNGLPAFESRLSAASSFSEGLAAAQPEGEDSLYGYIDKTGKFVIPPSFESASPFGEGKACVALPDGLGNCPWKIIDASGRELCGIGSGETVWTARSFREGLCAVCEYLPSTKKYEGQYKYVWGFINAAGKVVIPCQYDTVTDFVSGIAEVVLDGKIGYINSNGQYVWQPG